VKKRFLRLQKKFNHAVRKWTSSQSQMHLATLKLWKAKIEYYEVCFQAYGKYCPEFYFSASQNREYSKELKSLNIPFDFSQYRKNYFY
jgi:hypothetical protein